MMRSIITALVALVIGAAGMYFYQQGAVSELRNAAAALQTQAAQAKWSLSTGPKQQWSSAAVWAAEQPCLGSLCSPPSMRARLEKVPQK